MKPFEWQKGRQPRRLLCFSAAFFMTALVFSLLVSHEMELVSAVVCTAVFAVFVAIFVISLLKEQFYLFSSLFMGLLLGVLWCGGYGFFVWQPTQRYDGAVGEIRLELTEYAESKESYGVAYGLVTQLDGTPCRLKVKAYLRDGSPDYGPGDVMTFQGKLQAASRDFRSNLLQEGVFLTLSQETDGSCQPRAALTLLRRARILSREISQRTLKLLPGDEGALLASLLSGEQDHFSSGFERALTASGTRHIVSVSGLHMSILAGILITLFGKKLGLLVSVPLSVVYAAIVGFSPSVVRAAVLLIFWAASFWLKEEKDSLTSFAAGLLLLLVYDPFASISMSLLLSFGATLGLILLSAPLNALWIDRIKPIQKKPLKQVLWYVSGTVTSTLAATLFTLPLTILFFDSVPLLSILSNLLVLWVLSFTMMGGILMLCVGLLSLWTANFLAGYVLVWPLRWCVWVIETIGGSRFAATDSANGLMLLSCLILLAAALFWKRNHLPGKTMLALTLILICLTGLFTIGERMLFGVAEVENAGGQPVILLRGQGVSVINTGIRPQSACDAVTSALTRWNAPSLNTILCTSETYKTQSGLAAILSETGAKRILLPSSEASVRADLAGYPVETYSAGGVISISGCRAELLMCDDGAHGLRLLCGDVSLLSLCGVKPRSVPALLQAYDCTADILLIDDAIANDTELLLTICSAVRPAEILLATNGYSELAETFSGIPLTKLINENRAFRFKR